MDVTETLTPEHYLGMHNATVGVSASSQDASQGSYTSWTFNLPEWIAPNVVKNAQTFELTQSFDAQPLNHAEPTPRELADTIEPHAILPDDISREFAPLPEPETATPRLDVPIDLSHFTDVSDTPIALPDLSREPTVEIKSLIPPTTQKSTTNQNQATLGEETIAHTTSESLAQDGLTQEIAKPVDEQAESKRQPYFEIIEDNLEVTHEIVFDDMPLEAPRAAAPTFEEPRVESTVLKEDVASQIDVIHELPLQDAPEVAQVAPRVDTSVPEEVEERVDVRTDDATSLKRRPLASACDYVRRFRHAVDSVEARLLFLGRKKRPWAVALFLSLACCPPLGALASYYFARVFTSIMKQDVATAALYLEETRKTLRGVAVLVFIAMCLFLLRLALIDVYEG